MATWQQSGNPGGILASLGGNNVNAPQASDADATLATIRQNNELERSGRNNLGLQALQGLTSVMDINQKREQVQRQAEFQQAYGNAYASGDRNAMRQLAAQYPDQVDAVRNGMKFVDDDQRASVGALAAAARLASSSPEAMSSWLQNNASELARVGLSPQEVAQTYQKDPKQFGEFVDHLGMAALGPVDYFNVQDKIVSQGLNRDKLSETIRSNQAGEALTARGQDITVRGQNISAQNARMSANGPTSAMQNYGEYSRLLKTDPEAAAIFAQAAGINTAAASNRQVQLSDGRTVTVGGKLHGAGQNAFYEGRDDNGNVVRVPASAIAAPATSAASAGNYAMAKDLTAIENASPETLGFMTGVTGGNGSPAIGADVRSRISGKDERQVYNAAQRIQGKMQNQGIAAARDMGASGINTVAEAKMYFQGMPQIDFSSPDAVQESVRNIRQYTDQYNQQYNVSVGGRGGQKEAQQTPQPAQQPPRQPSASGSYTSKSGIQFTVK
ncbi:phage DNA ejection protein [Enterobacter kobei]|uniref:phage DNA ejection protein n=1 Tax=Enterobacter kobei TaxID=208224 RepID=UPI0028D2F09B|nr:phage DNA ejection protein [Enterobacter kobei]WNP36249.1 phage DNA ejection protein [Enterobacter kobei]